MEEWESLDSPISLSPYLPFISSLFRMIYELFIDEQVHNIYVLTPSRQSRN